MSLYKLTLTITRTKPNSSKWSLWASENIPWHLQNLPLSSLLTQLDMIVKYHCAQKNMSLNFFSLSTYDTLSWTAANVDQGLPTVTSPLEFFPCISCSWIQRLFQRSPTRVSCIYNKIRQYIRYTWKGVNCGIICMAAKWTEKRHWLRKKLNSRKNKNKLKEE